MRELARLDGPEEATRGDRLVHVHRSIVPSLPMSFESRPTHGSRSSRMFQTIASRPPGRRIRAISGSATGWSNQ